MTGAAPGTIHDPDELVVHHEVVADTLPRRRRLGTGVGMVLAGVAAIFGWGVGADPGDAVFQFAQAGQAVSIPALHVPGTAVGIAFGALIVALGAWQLARGFGRRHMKWVVSAAVVLFVLAFLVWAATGTHGNAIDVVGLLQQTVFLSVPLLLGAMAGILCERTGVINIAIEGQMLVGAFAGALGASVAHNLGIGIVAALVAGGLMGMLLAVFAIRFLVNQIVLGVVLNALALGVTGYGFDALMQENGARYNSPAVLSNVQIPVLSDIPVIGKPLFDANLIVYATYVLIIGIDIALFRTRWGLRTRAIGEHPKAADTVGIKVLRTRYWNVVLGGVIAGLAGAYLTIGSSGAFVKSPTGMTSGRGFIALAAVIFGRWSPRGAVGAALLFGFSSELQTLLSAIGTPVTIPANFLLMMPYIVTLLAVAGLVGRVRPPAADGEPYTVNE